MANVLEGKDRQGGDTSRQIEGGGMSRQTGEEMCTHRQERRDGHMDRGDRYTQTGDMYMQTDRRQVYTDRQGTCTCR